MNGIQNYELLFDNTYKEEKQQKLNFIEKLRNYKDILKKHKFKRIKSHKLRCCPSCNYEELATFAQYVYYSNIFYIRKCTKCGLYFSDRLLAPEIVLQHFENSYKDEVYFEHHSTLR